MVTVVQRRRVSEPSRLARPVAEPIEERPFWQVVALLYGGIFLLAVVLTTVCFLSAWLAAGSPY